MLPFSYAVRNLFRSKSRLLQTMGGSALVVLLVMAAVARAIARPIPGRGIVLPMFVPPILSALLAILLAREFAAPCAYIAGTAGTLIGADILNLRRLKDYAGIVSIGGAGVFDGIFLVGVVAVFLTALV